MTTLSNGPEQPRQPPPRVSVLVCSKERRPLLINCLESLGRQTYPHDRTEIVVAEELSEWAELPRIPGLAESQVRHVRVEPHRRGYGHPRNIAVRQAAHDLVAFIDDDCEAEPGWLSRLVATFRASDCKGVGGAVSARSPGLLGMCELAAGFPGGGIRKAVWSGGRPRRSDGFSTCNALLSRREIDAAGGFDEGLVHGGEDTLLAGRMAAASEPFIYEPRAVVYHRPRGSWRGIARWFFRRGRARVAIADRSGGRSELGWELLRTSVLLRVAVAAGVAGALRSPALFLAFIGVYYGVLAAKYAFIVSRYKLRGLPALAIMPLVRIWMDVWFELGVITRVMARADGGARRNQAGMSRRSPPEADG